MNALTPVFLNAEFWLLWSARQLLRGIAIGIGLTSGMVTLALLTLADAVAGPLDALQRRSHSFDFSRNPKQLATHTRG